MKTIIIAILFFATLLNANDKELINYAKANLPQPCLFYIKLYNQAKDNRAFAIAIDNKNRYACKFSAKSKTTQKAKEIALKSCEKVKKKRKIEASCYLLALNNTILTKEPQKASSIKLPDACVMFYTLYKKAPSFKAFAVAIDNNKKYTCRFSSKSETDEKAREVALASCEKMRKERDIISECTIFEKDDKSNNIEPPLPIQKTLPIDTNSSSLPIAQTQPSLEDIEKQISKEKPKEEPKEKLKEEPKKVEKNVPTQTDIKKINLPAECKMIYSLYLKATSPKAFAVAIDDTQKFTCRYSSQSDSEAKAKKVALESCQKKRKERDIKDNCHIIAFNNIDFLSTLKPVKKGKFPKFKTFIYEGNLKKVKEYIKKGADVNTRAQDNSRALYVAVARGDIAFTKTLLKKGANPIFRTTAGNNLLVAAIMSGKNELLKLMLDQDISPNKPCEDGNTPLHFAFMVFNEQMMQTLFKYGADENIKNKKGESVKKLASKYHCNIKRLKKK